MHRRHESPIRLIAAARLAAVLLVLLALAAAHGLGAEQTRSREWLPTGLAESEALRHEQVAVLALDSLSALPEALIREHVILPVRDDT